MTESHIQWTPDIADHLAIMRPHKCLIHMRRYLSVVLEGYQYTIIDLASIVCTVYSISAVGRLDL